MADKFCPCCGGVLAFVGVQEQHPLSTRPAKLLVECSNIDCELYRDTGTLEGLTDWWENEQTKRRASK